MKQKYCRSQHIPGFGICEAVNGTLKKTAFELLGKATELAGGLGFRRTCRGRCKYLGYGASKVHRGCRWAGCCATSLQKAEDSPAVDLLQAFGRDAFARLSARMKSGLGGEITEMRIEEGSLVAIRPQFSGKVFSQVQIATECKLFTVRPGSFAIPSTTDAVAEVVALDVALEDRD